RRRRRAPPDSYIYVSWPRACHWIAVRQRAPVRHFPLFTGVSATYSVCNIHGVFFAAPIGTAGSASISDGSTGCLPRHGDGLMAYGYAKVDAPTVALFSVLAAAAASLLPLSTVFARSPDPPNATAIQAATFEVLAPVAGVGSNGVVGTAFAIGPNQFVTAAHTLDQIIGSRFARPVLMDSNRVGYEIADILHYSQPQDYVVFSLVNPPSVTPLQLRRDEGTQRAVYFAGRRSGGGIVITRGTLMGRTRESESGQFDWLRFKSRIWAGVSGGPLLDEAGEVIGIVRARARDS